MWLFIFILHTRGCFFDLFYILFRPYSHLGVLVLKLALFFLFFIFILSYSNSQARGGGHLEGTGATLRQAAVCLFGFW